MKLTLFLFCFELFSLSKIWILIHLRVSYDLLNWLGSGLKCQVCNGPIGLCTNGSDNGESKECSKGLDACYNLPGGKAIFKVR